MTTLLLAGALVGVILGTIHAMHMYRRRRAEGRADVAEAGYYALWTFVLWVVFGTYILIFWVIGSAGMILSRVVKGSGR